MSFIESIKIKFADNGTVDKKVKKTEVQEETKGKEGNEDVSYASKESASAISSQAKAAIGIGAKEQPAVKNVNTAKLIGNFFPNMDNKQLTKNYIEFRQKARETARTTTKKLYKTFTAGDLTTVKNKKGDVVRTFEIPENKEGESVYDQETCSYMMKEFDPKTGKLKAITRVFNHDGFGTHWPKLCNPRMERIEYGETPDDTTLLKASFRGTHKDGRFYLTPVVELYAEGYQTDGKIIGERKAEKWLSTSLYPGYESYRERYTAHSSIFDANGTIYGARPDKTAEGGLKEENFARGLEYPVKQMQIGDTLFASNAPYLYEHPYAAYKGDFDNPNEDLGEVITYRVTGKELENISESKEKTIVQTGG